MKASNSFNSKSKYPSLNPLSLISCFMDYMDAMDSMDDSLPVFQLPLCLYCPILHSVHKKIFFLFIAKLTNFEQMLLMFGVCGGIILNYRDDVKEQLIHEPERFRIKSTLYKIDAGLLWVLIP